MPVTRLNFNSSYSNKHMFDNTAGYNRMCVHGILPEFIPVNRVDVEDVVCHTIC